MLSYILCSIIESIEYDLIETIEKIKSGDQALRDSFINDYKPFIKKSIALSTGKWIDTESSEEFSIGLMAFNESINSFNPGKYSNFLSFSRYVIKRRLIDHMRKNHSDNVVMPLSSFTATDTGDFTASFEEKYLKSEAHKQFENIESAEEIIKLKQKLLSFGISMTDLALASPKHKDSMRLVIKIARVLAEDDSLFSSLERKKTIPMSDLLKRLDVHIRTVEKHRKFIIGVCYILRSNLDILKSYAQILEKEGVRNV